MAHSKTVLALALIVMFAVGFGAGVIAEQLLTPQSKSSDTIWDNIVNSGKIKIGSDPAWPQYESLDSDGNFVGFEVDLVNAIAQKLGLAAEWHNTSFVDIMPLVENRTLDLGVSGFSVTPDRLSHVSFTFPHSVARRQILMNINKQGSFGVTTLTCLEQLKSLDITVGAQTGTTQIDELTNAQVNYRSFDCFDLLIADMMSANSTVDAAYVETPLSPTMAMYISTGMLNVVYNAPYYPCGFITNTDAQIFTQKVNGAIAELTQSGQIDALKAKWSLTT